MNQNPYIYKGALYPVKDSLVCVPRKEEIEKVIKGIKKGDYWVIVGPRQIGKTTFLRQIEKKFLNAYYIYFNFEKIPDTTNGFYEWLIEKFLEEIPIDPTYKAKPQRITDNPEFQFFKFLSHFKPKDNKKIILLFDEIEGISFIKEFLNIWRKVHDDRYRQKELYCYAVVIAASADLIALSAGKTSPYNISEILYLKDFSQEESDKLISKPLGKLNITIELKAKEKLMSLVSGHPQMLQHYCHKLVEKIEGKIKILTETDINDTLEIVLRENTNLDLLKQDMNNNTLVKLVELVQKGEKKKFNIYKEYSFQGAGCISEDENGFCKIRNEIYKRFIKDKLPTLLKDHQDNKKPLIFICYSHIDKEWKDMLCKHLGVLGNGKNQVFWHDNLIKTGKNFDDEIQQNIRKADIALFLISADSLRSPYIQEKEIPLIRTRSETEGLIFFPILVEPCAWKSVKWLARIQIWPKNGRALAEETKNEQNKNCIKIVTEISMLLENKEKEEE